MFVSITYNRRVQSNFPNNTVLHFKQLYDFTGVARSGGLIRAAERLNQASQTLSGQLSRFEERLGPGNCG